jgi:hypothetical protein
MDTSKHETSRLLLQPSAFMKLGTCWLGDAPPAEQGGRNAGTTVRSRVGVLFVIAVHVARSVSLQNIGARGHGSWEQPWRRFPSLAMPSCAFATGATSYFCLQLYVKTTASSF